MNTKWTVETWSNDVRGGFTVFHIHNNWKVFSERNIKNFPSYCPLCKELVPDYILFQWKLLDRITWEIKNKIIFTKENESVIEFKKKSGKCKSYTIDKSVIDEIKKILSYYKYKITELEEEVW